MQKDLLQIGLKKFGTSNKKELQKQIKKSLELKKQWRENKIRKKAMMVILTVGLIKKDVV